MGHTWKSLPHLKKCGTVDEMEQPWKNAPHWKISPKFSAYRAKAGQNHDARMAASAAPYLEKCATLGKLGNTWKMSYTSKMPHSC